MLGQAKDHVQQTVGLAEPHFEGHIAIVIGNQESEKVRTDQVTIRAAQDSPEVARFPFSHRSV